MWSIIAKETGAQDCIIQCSKLWISSRISISTLTKIQFKYMLSYFPLWKKAQFSAEWQFICRRHWIRILQIVRFFLVWFDSGTPRPFYLVIFPFQFLPLCIFLPQASLYLNRLFVLFSALAAFWWFLSPTKPHQLGSFLPFGLIIYAVGSGLIAMYSFLKSPSYTHKAGFVGPSSLW